MTQIFGSHRLAVTGSVRGFVVAILSVAALMAGASKTSSDTPKPVHVREYKRKDGTVVKAYDRAAPGTATRPAGSAPRSPSPTTPRTPSSHTGAGAASKTTTLHNDHAGPEPGYASLIATRAARRGRSTAVRVHKESSSLQPQALGARGDKEPDSFKWIHVPSFGEH